GDERGCERVLQVALDGDDLARVVRALTVCVLRSGDRLLRVVDGVVRVLVSGLVDGGVELLAANEVALVRRSVVADEEDLLVLLLLSSEDSVFGHAPVDVDAAKV